MNIFNRIVMIFLIPLTAALVTLLLLVPLDVWNRVAQFFATTVPTQEAVGLYQTWWVRLILIGIAMVVDFILLFLFLLEIRRAPQRMIRVRRAAGGEVRLPVDSIAQRLAYHVDQISDVIDVRPSVGERRGGVTVHIFASTAPDVDVPAKADEIINAVQWVVREKLGLTMAGDPKVELRVAPYPQSSRVEAAARPPAPQR